MLESEFLAMEESSQDAEVAKALGIRPPPTFGTADYDPDYDDWSWPDGTCGPIAGCFIDNDDAFITLWDALPRSEGQEWGLREGYVDGTLCTIIGDLPAVHPLLPQGFLGLSRKPTIAPVCGKRCDRMRTLAIALLRAKGIIVTPTQDPPNAQAS